jgi:hypothetical protein
LGWIRFWLVKFLLDAALRWSEPEAAGMSSTGTSINKARSIGRLDDGGHGNKFFSSAHGDLEVEELVVVGCRVVSLWLGRREASFGSASAASQLLLPHLMVERRPLPPCRLRFLPAGDNRI